MHRNKSLAELSGGCTAAAIHCRCKHVHTFARAQGDNGAGVARRRDLHATAARLDRTDAIPLERCLQLAATLDGIELEPAPAPAPVDALDPRCLTTDVGLKDGSPAPPLTHWLGWQTKAPMSELGSDGHPLRGGAHDMSPKGVPDAWRRMFGGSTVQTHGAGPAVGCPLRRVSLRKGVTDKQGSASPLKLSTVVHEYTCVATGDHVLTDTQTIVYIAPQSRDEEADTPVEDKRRQQKTPTTAPVLPLLARWRPTTTTLFRYSALTFNGHRIHYDAEYARNVEGYPGLVVHGPLLATALAWVAAQRVAVPSGLRIVGFRWRAVAPVFCGDKVTLHCALPDVSTGTHAVDTVHVPLHILNGQGGVAITGEASLGR